MKGSVDDFERALLPITVASGPHGEFSEIVVWIDTAFDGHLVFPTGLIERIGLDHLAETEAILADGTKVSLESYFCVLDWFGEKIPVQVIENEGRFPLLGTGLLAGRDVHISYREKTIAIT